MLTEIDITIRFDLIRAITLERSIKNRNKQGQKVVHKNISQGCNLIKRL